MRRVIRIYDTTLRDGTQGEGVSFSMEDKVRLASRLDALGIHYIEGGWPGSNPKDLRFFRRMQDVTLKHAKLAAFSMTRRAGGTAESDANMQALLDAGAPVATIVGKAWDFQVTHALSTTLDENLKMIADTIAFLRPRTEEVMFDAEHFFDGFRRNREYALATLRAAEAAGAHWLVLCDTNGGTLPRERAAIRVAEHEPVGAGGFGGPERRERVFAVPPEAVEEMLGVEHHLLRTRTEEGDRVGDHLQVFVERRRERVGHLEVPRLADDRRDGRARVQERLHVGVRLGGAARTAGHAERRELRVLERHVLHPAEEAQVLGIGARPASLDVVDAERVEPRRQADLVLHREGHSLALRPVPEGRVIDPDQLAHGLLS